MAVWKVLAAPDLNETVGLWKELEYNRETNETRGEKSFFMNKNNSDRAGGRLPSLYGRLVPAVADRQQVVLFFNIIAAYYIIWCRCTLYYDPLLLLLRRRRLLRCYKTNLVATNSSEHKNSRNLAATHKSPARPTKRTTTYKLLSRSFTQSVYFAFSPG